MKADEACKFLELQPGVRHGQKEIRTAYKKACLKHHPDKNVGDEGATAR